METGRFATTAAPGRGNRCPARVVICSLFVAAANVAQAAADELPFVSPAFGDHMVLQRGRENVMWGWSEPGSTVTVQIADSSASGSTGADGRWMVRFDPPPAGGPYMVRISGPETIELSDVLVGDVWLCSGQSNMAFGLAAAENGQAEVAAADHPGIRLFVVPQRSAYEEKAVPEGAWKACTPEAVGAGGGPGFSAVAYFFGRRLHQELGVPIGLIQDCVGGTPVESWMSGEALQPFPEFSPQLSEIARMRGTVSTVHGSFLMHWLEEYDAGERDGTPWSAAELDDSGWQTVTVPGGFAGLGMADLPAVAWFRREVDLPDPLPEGPIRLVLGKVDKMDTTFVNGTWVGASSWVENPRRYRVRDDIARPGRNTIAVRIFKRGAGGGFPSDAAMLRLELGDGTSIPLAGEWKGRVSVDARDPHKLPLDVENYPTMPTVMYNGMVAPLAPMALRGFLWYQGEANFLRAYQYRSLLPALIADWRQQFGRSDLPFYVASLPAFMERREQPGDDAWSELREAQMMTVATVPDTALAVTIDTGDAEDIHPREKRPVGERLALCALGQTYGRDVVWRGPTLASHEIDGATVRLRFENLAGGLVIKGDAPGEFSIAGDDRVWHWAQAVAEGDSIVVSSAEVPEPRAVRYAWQANPRATVFNAAGLPAAPFRTDDWPGVTAPR